MFLAKFPSTGRASRAVPAKGSAVASAGKFRPGSKSEAESFSLEIALSQNDNVGGCRCRALSEKEWLRSAMARACDWCVCSSKAGREPMRSREELRRYGLSLL